VLLTRSPLDVNWVTPHHTALDLHVSCTPPALILSQDQTLHEYVCVPVKPGVDMLDEAYAGPCSIARDPRPSRKVVSTLQVSRFMARQVHDGIPGNAAVGSTPERATPGVYRSGGLRSS